MDTKINKKMLIGYSILLSGVVLILCGYNMRPLMLVLLGVCLLLDSKLDTLK